MPTGPILIGGVHGAPKIRNPLRPKWVDQITKACLYVINLSETTHVLQRTYGAYFIEGIKEGEQYTVTKVHGRIATLDEGDNVRSQQIIEADEIAACICMQINEGILCKEGYESFGGAFVSETNPPSPKDLKKNIAKLMSFYDGQIELADQFWDDPHDHKNISSLMRRAARIRNQSRPWTYLSVEMLACPACGVNVRVGLAICKECGAILDEEKARKFFPERFVEASAVARDTESKPTSRRANAPQRTQDGGEPRGGKA